MATNNTNNPHTEIFAALKQLERERGIPADYMIEKITQALLAAYKKDRAGYTDNVLFLNALNVCFVKQCLLIAIITNTAIQFIAGSVS